MARNTINIVIGGAAGQGLVTIGELLVRSLARSGYHFLVTQGYMSRIRGGHNTFAVRAGNSNIQAPVTAIDILLALDPETALIHHTALTQGGITIANDAPPVPDSSHLIPPYATFCPKAYWNVAALGVVGALIGLEQISLEGAIVSLIGRKKPEAVEPNKQALAAAYTWVSGLGLDGFRLREQQQNPGRLTLTGNDAIALGAIAAGVRFCAFYPMSPSTSIPLVLAEHAGTAGLIVEQAEDEIAAINMAIGASYAGAPAMVTTAGGGFALMGEGVSLAGMTETPVVIVVAQRPGPATGLPTRTEQGDLDLVLYAGHGEFPRAVLTPGTPEECYSLTRLAFRLARETQGPVFILTDQCLADSYRAVLPFDTAPHPQYEEPAASPELPYKRYRLTADGVSPRLLPGAGPALVIADSDEHTEDGHITEDLDVRRQMVEKRLSKLELLRKSVSPPTYLGPLNPELLLVCWGSSKGATEEAMMQLNSAGKATGMLHFSQVWPLNPDLFLHRLQTAAGIICVEGNATGQFAGLLSRETGIAVDGVVARYDGLPFTAEFIMKGVEACLILE